MSPRAVLEWRTIDSVERHSVQNELRTLAGRTSDGELKLLDQDGQLLLAWESEDRFTPRNALDQVLSALVTNFRRALLKSLDADQRSMDENLERDRKRPGGR